MLSTKPVLPNFLKTLVIATMATASVSAFAGDHEGAEEKIGDLKDMKAKSSELKADELTSELDSSAAKKDAASAKAKEAMTDAEKAVADEAKPEL